MIKIPAIIGGFLGAFALVTLLICRGPRKSTSTPFTVSLDHIKTMREVHLTRYYFEQIVPVEKKDKLKTLIIVPATIDAYINMDELTMEEDSAHISFILPSIRLSEVNFTIDSAKIYGFKNFGIYFSDNAYSEAVEDIQSGLRQARVDIRSKAISQGILELAAQEARSFIQVWVHPVSEKVVQFKD